MSAQKYNNNQAHVFWSDDWRPQADHDIYYSRWLCTPELKETRGSWGHELACVQTTPPPPSPLPSGKIGEGLRFFLRGAGSVHRLATNTSRSSEKKQEIKHVKFMHAFKWNSLKQLTLYWTCWWASNQKLTLATMKQNNVNKQDKKQTKTSDDVVLKTDCVMVILFKKQNYSHGVHVGMKKIVLIRSF